MRLTKRIKKLVENWALNSLYRMNANTADCYTFNLYINDKGKLDFDGGWDWRKSLVDKGAKYLFILDTKEFVTL
jgi:hypothetical protein